MIGRSLFESGLSILIQAVGFSETLLRPPTWIQIRLCQVRRWKKEEIFFSSFHMLGRVTTCIWSLFLIEAVEINLVIQEAECISLADLLFFPKFDYYT